MNSLTDKEINRASDGIDKALSTATRSNRGEVAFRILSVVRNLNDHIAFKIWKDVRPDQKMDINKVASKFGNVRPYQFIARFDYFLRASVSHFTPSEEGAERLMIKYYRYLLQLKKAVYDRYGMIILRNIDMFLEDLDEQTKDYYMQKPVREDDGVITCFRDGEVTLRSNRREDGFTMSDKEIGYQGIDVGDLVVHGMDGFAGSIGISDSRGKASPVLNVLDTDQCKRYIMYYLRSMAYSDVFLALATGIRVRSCDLRWNKLAELSYPVPPLDEQNAIVKHIDSVLSKADAVIADKKAQLATLDEYKKSLIFEYVTGKKEVPAS